MSTVEAIHVETEAERIERWRSDELERAGYDPRPAARLAARLDIDPHGAASPLERGRPEDVAIRILL